MACEERGRGPAPLKLVVFGGTGLTGKEVVKQALEKGYSVTSVVRSPEKVEIRHPNLEVVKGDACGVESFASVLKGKDAVMSCLGVVASIFNPTTFYSESMHAIMEGMRSFADMLSSQIQVPDIRAIFYIPAGGHKCGMKRLVTMTAWCTQPGPNNSWLVDWFINPVLLNGMIKDMGTMERMLEQTEPESLDYTIVRPCGLFNGERTGNYKVEEGQCNTGTKYFITRADVAEFMLKTLESNEFNRKGFAVAGL